jgi:PAS domain S-box-containing protein
MPSLTVLIEALIIGVSLIATVNHLIMAVILRDRKVHLTFALVALMVAVFQSATLLSYHSTSLAEMVTAHRWRAGAACVALAAFPWFARYFSGERGPHQPAIALSLGYGLLFLINIFAPYSISFTTIERLSDVRLPWGESVVQAVGPVSVWVLISYMMFFAMMGLSCYGGVRQYRRGEKGPALALLISVAIFTLLVVIGFYVRIGALAFTFPGGYGFIGFVIAMSLYLSEHLRRAYHRASESEQRLRAVIDTSDAVIYMKDVDGTYRLVNRRFEALSGMTQDQVRGKTDREIFPQDCADRFHRNDQHVLTSGTSLEFEETVVQDDGAHTYQSIKVALKDARGEVYGLCCVSTDITAARRLEEQLSRQREQLEAQVEQRTEQLRRINGELEAFSYAVSHDLQAPLRAVEGFSSVLMENYRHKLDEKGLDFLARIQSSSQKMADMIRALLDLSRISRQELHKAPVDLSSLGDEVITELAHTDPRAHVTVTVQDRMLTDGDPGLLKIALSNLLGNAWKYTGKTRDATIDFGQLERDGQKVFYVRDNGAGFDMAYKDRLMVPFQRLHSDREFAGTGIGLSTVARIIGRHGGKVWAEGEPGAGATFWFTL